MTSASLSTISNIVGDTTTLSVTFTPARAIPSGGYIKMLFPYWNPNGIILKYYFPGAVSCGVYTCSFSTSSNVLSVSIAPNGNVVAGSPMTFTANGFRNPLSGTPVSGI
jgi:hypothetical protein